MTRDGQMPTWMRLKDGQLCRQAGMDKRKDGTQANVKDDMLSRYTEMQKDRTDPSKD